MIDGQLQTSGPASPYERLTKRVTWCYLALAAALLCSMFLAYPRQINYTRIRRATDSTIEVTVPVAEMVKIRLQDPISILYPGEGRETGSSGHVIHIEEQDPDRYLIIVSVLQQTHLSSLDHRPLIYGQSQTLFAAFFGRSR